MSEDVAIKVSNLSKSFKLPHEKQSSIKGALISRLKGSKRSYELQEVLRDISFEINKGDFFGIVGRNGSGKSTLLKLLAGIYTPTTGSIHVNGKLTPFIELGVGFNPDLTGRENVFLNGALLGFNRHEMESMYDEIVAFAELKRFMDQKLKNYSSGMQVRLAFSIAIRANTNILVLDEVLAVGDAAFQQKCNDYFEQQKAKKQTIVLVTHDMASVEKYCTKAMMIENGEIVAIGKPETVAEKYTSANQRSIEDQMVREPDSPGANGMKSIIKTADNKEKYSFAVGEKMRVFIDWKNLDVQNVGVAIFRQSGERMFATNTQESNFSVKGDHCVYELELNLAPGKYYIRVRAFGKDSKDTKALIEQGPTILVRSGKHKVDGLIPLPHTWMNT